MLWLESPTAYCKSQRLGSIKSHIYEYTRVFLQWWQPEKDFCPEELRLLHATVI